MDDIEEAQHVHRNELIERLRSINDPVDRITAIKAALDTNATLRRSLADLHGEAIRELRATMTAKEIAARLGITEQRVGQLARRYP